MRSLKKGQPWLVMEQATAAVSQWSVNVSKLPGQMRLGSYQAIAQGADSILFFQWRQAKGGTERYHSGMVNHAGPQHPRLPRSLPAGPGTEGPRRHHRHALRRQGGHRLRLGLLVGAWSWATRRART